MSQAKTKFKSIVTRKIVVLAAGGFNMEQFDALKKLLKKERALVKIVAPHGGSITCDQNMEHKVGAAILTIESVKKNSQNTLQREKAKNSRFLLSSYCT